MIHLWPEEWTRRGGEIDLSAVLEGEGGGRFRLWYRVPADLEPALTRSCDPFVLGGLFAAMRSGGKMLVHGEVSPSLLRNLDEFQSAWVLWRPGTYRKVEITAGDEREGEPPRTGAAVMGFSGGVDSSFTAWRHRRGLAGRQGLDLAAGVMVHGFDIPLEDGAYRRASENARAMLLSIGMELIPVATNFRALGDDWEDAFGAALASCLGLLRGRFAAGVIASSYAYSYLTIAYGSTPLADHLFSSRSFPIIHDGAGFTRLEKTRAVARWPEALERLRVCWEGAERDRNCCRCQKCITNIIYFRIAGVERLPCFPLALEDERIAAIPHRDAAMAESTRRLIAVARENGIRASWVEALEASLGKPPRSGILARLRALRLRPGIHGAR